MAIEQAKLFFEQMNTDQQLTNKLKKIMEEHQVNVTNKIIEVAQDNGFEISRGMLNEYNEAIVTNQLEKSELQESEMEHVSGGGSYDENHVIAVEKMLKLSRKLFEDRDYRRKLEL